MAEYQGGIKISQLDDVNRINDNDIVPFTNNDMGDSQTRKIRLDSLRDHLNYANAYTTTQEGLSNSIPGQIFHVYIDATKLDVNAYRNDSGQATLINDAEGNPVKGTTGNFLNYLRSPLGYTAIGRLDSFQALRTTKPPFDGAVIEVNGYLEGGTDGGGCFVGRIGSGVDDGGVIASGAGFFWERLDISNGISPHLFGYVSGSGKDGTLELTRALQVAERLGRPVVFPDGFKMSLNQPGIAIASKVDLLVSNFGTAYIEITHEVELTSQFILGGRNKISGLSFYYSKQTKDTNVKPVIKFGPLFSGAGYYSKLTNINIGNAYYGFKIGGNDEGSASYITLRDINGAPLYRGLSLDRCLDIPRISDIHWNYNIYLGTPEDYKQTLRQWIHDNGTGFHFGRVDFAEVQRIFAFGYNRGILLLGERYTGSSDSIRFTGCDMDICANPIWAQNFQGQLIFRNGKYTGNSTSVNGLVKPVNGCYNYFQRVSPAARVIIEDVTFNNYDKDAIRTGNDTVMTGCKIYAYGTDGQQRAGIAVISGSNASVTVDKCYINAVGTDNRGIAGSDSTGSLMIMGATVIENFGLEGYRWLPGKSFVQHGCVINGTSRASTSFINAVRNDFYSVSVPTTGGFGPGDKVWRTSPTIEAFASQAQFVIMGWLRMTSMNETADNHTVGVDWIEIRAYTEEIPKLSVTGSGRPNVTRVGFQFFDTALGKPIWLKTPAPNAVWVDGTGTPV